LHDTTGILLGIHCNFTGGLEGQLDDRAYNVIINDLKNCDYPTTWEPPVVTPRIAAQHSQFLYSTVCDSTLGSLKITEPKEALVCLEITPEIKAEALSILKQVFDIYEATLFPDLDGFGKSNNHTRIPESIYRSW
jgi:hypothetical protein